MPPAWTRHGEKDIQLIDVLDWATSRGTSASGALGQLRTWPSLYSTQQLSSYLPQTMKSAKWDQADPLLACLLDQMVSLCTCRTRHLTSGLLFCAHAFPSEGTRRINLERFWSPSMRLFHSK